MTSAFKCNACGEFREGSPAIYVDIDPDARLVGGNIVFSGSSPIEWNRRDTDLEVCRKCAPDAVVALMAAIRDTETDTDSPNHDENE